MSSPSDRETRLNSLRLKLGRELEEDFRKAGSDFNGQIDSRLRTRNITG